jgi:putative protein kinase ArgK-like GTPase of G3E family
MLHTGIEDLWSALCDFRDTMNNKNEISRIRKQQLHEWFWIHLKEDIISKIMQKEDLKSDLKKLEKDIANEKITPGQASDYLIKKFIKKNMK